MEIIKECACEYCGRIHKQAVVKKLKLSTGLDKYFKCDFCGLTNDLLPTQKTEVA